MNSTKSELAPRRSAERITKACDNCGKPVTRLASANAPRFYCDHACYSSSKSRSEASKANNAARHASRRVKLTCYHCGTSFVRPQSRTRGKSQAFCSREHQYAYRRAQQVSFINANGYVVVGVPAGYPNARRNGNGGQILEHRKVMQDVLGRPLTADENVHHRNGVKTDNRIENLELWSKSQPAGQRVKEKLEWARSIIALYDNLPPQAR